MASIENVGQQFVHLYRGFAKENLSEIDFDNLGQHWTSKKHVAANFAGQMAGMKMGPGADVTGVIVTARVPKEQVNRIKVPNHDDLEQINEHEHRVTPGTPVEIKEVQKVNLFDGKITRVLDEPYDAPKQGKA
jgi:hypothetical protein